MDPPLCRPALDVKVTGDLGCSHVPGNEATMYRRSVVGHMAN